MMQPQTKVYLLFYLTIFFIPKNYAMFPGDLESQVRYLVTMQDAFERTCREVERELNALNQLYKQTDYSSKSIKKFIIQITYFKHSFGKKILYLENKMYQFKTVNDNGDTTRIRTMLKQRNENPKFFSENLQKSQTYCKWLESIDFKDIPKKFSSSKEETIATAHTHIVKNWQTLQNIIQELKEFNSEEEEEFDCFKMFAKFLLNKFFILE